MLNKIRLQHARGCFTVFFLNTILVFGAIASFDLKFGNIDRSIFTYATILSSCLFLIFLLQREKLKNISSEVSGPIFYSLVIILITTQTIPTVFTDPIATFLQQNIGLLLIATATAGVIYFQNGSTDPLFRLFKSKILASVIMIAGIAVIVFLYFSLASSMIYTIDEGYTKHAIEGYQKYGELSTTPSGAAYNRANIYTLITIKLSEVFSFLGVTDEKVLLRIASIFSSLLAIVLTYILALKVSSKHAVALLSSGLLAINWSYLAIGITARNYSFALCLFIAGLILVIKNSETSHTDHKRSLAIYSAFFAVVLFNYFEGFVIFSLHLLIFFVLSELVKLKLTKSNLVLYGTLCGTVMLGTLFISYTFRSSIDFIFNTFRLDISRIYWEAFWFQGASLSYIALFGLLVALIAIFLKTNLSNRKYFVLSVGVVAIVFIQIFLFAGKNTYPRYIFDMITPISILVGAFIYGNIGRHRVFISIVTASIILSSFFNIYKIYGHSLGYSFYNPLDYEMLVDNIPSDAVIFTDMPNTINLITKTHIVYAFRNKATDSEVVDAAGANIVNIYNNIPAVGTQLQKQRFRDADISKYIIIGDEQLYMYYDKTPLIMNVEHMKMITENNNVFVVLSHNAFEPVNNSRNPDLYYYMINNSEVLYNDYVEGSTFDSRFEPIPKTNPQVGSLLRITNESDAE